jgi:hypothetical protein
MKDAVVDTDRGIVMFPHALDKYAVPPTLCGCTDSGPTCVSAGSYLAFNKDEPVGYVGLQDKTSFGLKLSVAYSLCRVSYSVGSRAPSLPN